MSQFNTSVRVASVVAVATLLSSLCSSSWILLFKARPDALQIPVKFGCWKMRWEAISMLASTMSKVAIGSASFAMPYGVSNSSHPSPGVVSRILEMCSQSGVTIIDTAKEYGLAELVIGQVRPNNTDVYTKLLHGTDLGNLDSLRKQALNSIELLNVDSLKGLSVHDFQDYRGKASVANENLESLKTEGLINSWGLSLYEVSELEFLLEIGKADFIQVPANYLDRRFLDPQILELSSRAGMQVHVRSVFLQGALLMSPKNLPAQLEPLGPSISALRRAADDAGVSLQAFLLGFLTKNPGISQVLVGLNSIEQAENLIQALGEIEKFESDFREFDEVLPIAVIDPRLWSK